MLACIINDQGRLVLAQTDIPSPSRKDVLIKMMACGICGTDLEKLSGNYASRTLGHEAVGIVQETGKDVASLNQGEAVFPHHHVPCYGCHYCTSGSETMCPHFSASNIVPGGFAEYFIMPEWNISHGGLFSLPASINFKRGTLIEPLACVIRGIERLKLADDDTVAVIGTGSVGLLFVFALRQLGLRSVFAFDTQADRALFAKKLGADYASLPDDEGLLEILHGTEERGADAAVVCTGNSAATEYGIRSLRKGGRLLQFGLPHPQTRIAHDAHDLFIREISILSTYSACEREVAKAISMLENSGDSSELIISHSYDLPEAEEAFRMALDTRAARKVIIENRR